METKDTLSSCSYSDEQDMQKMLKQAKILKDSTTEIRLIRKSSDQFGYTQKHWTNPKKQDTSSRSGNDAHADDADIRPIYDEEPMVEVQTTAEINIFAIGQQHTEAILIFNNERKGTKCETLSHDTSPLPAKNHMITRKHER
ncbi:hypothetical protein Tco_0199797 [Tanacetum coccineum]